MNKISNPEVPENEPTPTPSKNPDQEPTTPTSPPKPNPETPPIWAGIKQRN